MTGSSTMSKQAEGVVDAGVTAFLHWNEDTNSAATVKIRAGRLDVEAEAAHHSNEYAAATVFEHADGRLVAEAAAARHSNADLNAAAVEPEQAAAALNLDEGASTTAAQNLGKDTHTWSSNMQSE